MMMLVGVVPHPSQSWVEKWQMFRVAGRIKRPQNEEQDGERKGNLKLQKWRTKLHTRTIKKQLP